MIPEDVCEGFWWGRSHKGFKWYNLIIKVEGNAPFLKIKVCDLSATFMVFSDKWILSDVCWGPRIQECGVPKEEIENVR